MLTLIIYTLAAWGLFTLLYLAYLLWVWINSDTPW